MWPSRRSYRKLRSKSLSIFINMTLSLGVLVAREKKSLVAKVGKGILSSQRKIIIFSNLSTRDLYTSIIWSYFEVVKFVSLPVPGKRSNAYNPQVQSGIYSPRFLRFSNLVPRARVTLDKGNAGSGNEIAVCQTTSFEDC